MIHSGNMRLSMTIYMVVSYEKIYFTRLDLFYINCDLLFSNVKFSVKLVVIEVAVVVVVVVVVAVAVVVLVTGYCCCWY